MLILQRAPCNTPLYVYPCNVLAFLAFSNMFAGSSLAQRQEALDLDQIFQFHPLEMPRAHFDKSRSYH